ncbi:hypothetical protein [Borreliella valaisiana]|uniref:Uncharacterized protein n=2 Tax=Borreliella TaxID=64895 RepID=C0R977_BORVA|nr:hypothetical protein [Borreliella valaisiana]ACN53025.1 conserved hypothetical protein [Borreliella valaisiana VS116]WLN25726.1 hypothetical protein KJD10_04680 [Borreliella valaisiana]WVN14612.1 hypothetical protein KJD09_04635 [Borreliella valaisiana]
MINLLDESLNISVDDGNDNNQANFNNLKLTVDKFNSENSSIKVSLKNLINKIEVEKCIKTFMNNVETYFNGLRGELIKNNSIISNSEVEYQYIRHIKSSSL